MSLSSLLSIARSALLTHQRAMAITSHNVANAMTPGYSRQRLELMTATPQMSPQGMIGRGVDSAGVFRIRDSFVDAGYRRESGLLGRSNMTLNYLSQLESAINEPSDTGVAAAMDDLFQAFADLANDPTSGPARDLVRQAASRFTTLMNRLDSRITETQADVVTRMNDQVDEVNALAKQIAALNVSILAGGGAEHNAPDLADQRDMLVDRLSVLVDARVIPHPDGTIGVAAGNIMLLDGGLTTTLAVKPVAGGGLGIGAVGAAGTIDPRTGSLKALTVLSQTTLPAARAQLDQLAQAIVTEINALHRTGYTATGATNVDFFDAAGVTAGSIGLSAAVSADSTQIAAATSNAPGDGGLALQLSAMAGIGIGSLGNQSMREFYTRFAGGIGVQTRDAQRDLDIQDTLVARAEAQRASVSGVSVDEEMVMLISQQQAYGAAARLISVANEMMDDLLRLV